MHKVIIIVLAVVLLGAACTPGSLSTKSDGGVWYSAERGEKWEHRITVYEDRTDKRTIADVDAHKLLFSPNDTRKIFALTVRNGLWVSWNSGRNWDNVLASTDVNDLLIHPENPRLLYAASGNLVVRSENEGSSWRAVYTSDDPANTVESLAFAAANPSVLYAGTAKGEVLLSENGGASWRTLATLEGPVIKIAFHPSAPATGWAGVASRKGLFRSTDGGRNWAGFEEAFRDYTGANDFRDFAFIPSGIIYASKYGLLRSLNQGRDWVTLPLLSAARDSNIQALGVNPENPLEIYYGTRATFYRSVDGGFNWIPRDLPSTRSAASVLINPENVSELYLGVVRER